MQARKIAASVAIGGLVLGGGLWWQGQSRFTTQAAESENREAPLAVQALTVRPLLVPEVTELSGTLRSVETATVSTRVSGLITDVSVEEGERVRRGQVLARVDVADMSAQVAQANAGVMQAKANQGAAQATLMQQLAARNEAQASLRLARLTQERMHKLQGEGAVSREQFDQAQANLELAQARVAQVEAAIRQARAALAQSEAAIASARSAVRAATASASYGEIVAPFDGVVIEQLAHAGETTSIFGTPLLKLERTDRLRLEVPVPEDHLTRLAPGQPVQVRIDALARTLGGRVAQIVPAADPASRSFIVKIPLANPDGRLISGMFARLTLAHGTRQTLQVPAGAIVQRGQLQGVYVVSPDNRAQLRWIKAGSSSGNFVEIQAGMIAGERIVLAPPQSLSDGQPLTLQEGANAQ